MKFIFLLLCSVCLSKAVYSQNKEKTLFVVDSVPTSAASIWTNILDEYTKDIDDSDIYSVTAVGGAPAKKWQEERDIKPQADSIFFITTKEYHNRPEELKRVPSLLTFNRRKGLCYLEGNMQPYTGPFIVYYLSGKREAEGHCINGKVEDTVTSYFKDGHTVKSTKIFKAGHANGMYTRYFPNHKVKISGRYADGNKQGIWKEWYSTGRFKIMTVYNNGELSYLEDDNPFFKYIALAHSDKQFHDYHQAINDFNKAIAIKADFAEAYLDKSAAESRLSLYDSALSDLDKAVALEPEYLEAIAARIVVRLYKYKACLKTPLPKEDKDATESPIVFPAEEENKVRADLTTIIRAKKMDADFFTDYLLPQLSSIITLDELLEKFPSVE